jgi:trk system potassium uptake protein TrkA
MTILCIAWKKRSCLTSKKVVILGAGRRGLGLAKHLIEEHRNVVLIDNNPERIDLAVSKLDCMGILGNGTDLAKLNEAGCADADTFIAVTDSDEINLVSCGMVSGSFKGIKTVATIRGLIYTGTEGLTEGLLGIDHIVNPNAEAAQYIYNIIDQGVYSDVIRFSNSRLMLYNLYIEQFSPYIGSTLMDMRTRLKADFIIAAINRKGIAFVPAGNTVIEPRDTLSLVAETAEVSDILKTIGKMQRKPKKIVLVGASKIARALLNSLTPSLRSKIAVVDQNPVICNLFSERFPEILVIKADITDEDIMQEEQLTNYDLLIALTDNDELNIITASYAKRIGIEKSMALVKQNNNYVRLASYLDIDVVISTTDTTVDSLLRYLRGTNVTSLHSLFNGQLEIFEFTINSNSKACGKKLSELNMRKKAIVAGLTRKNSDRIIPTGNISLQEGDCVLVAVNRDSVGFIQNFFN